MIEPVNSVEAVLREILRVAPWPHHGGEPCGQYHAWLNVLRSARECLGETLSCPRCGAELAPTEVSEVGRGYYCTRCGDCPVTVKRIEERGTDD